MSWEPQCKPIPCGRPEPRPPAITVPKTSVAGSDLGWQRCLPLADGKPEGAHTDGLSLEHSHTAAAAAAMSLSNCWGQPSPWQPPKASWPQVRGGAVDTLSPGPGALWPLLMVCPARQPLEVTNPTSWVEGESPNRPHWPHPSPCIQGPPLAPQNAAALRA